MTEREGPAPTPDTGDQSAAEPSDEETQREAQSEDPTSPERGFDDPEDEESDDE